MSLDFSKYTQDINPSGATPTTTPPRTGGRLDFSKYTGDLGAGFATSQTPAQISGVKPQITDLGTAKEVVSGGLQEAPSRIVEGREFDATGKNILTKTIAGVGNFLFGSAPDILARQANKGFAEQKKSEIMNNAQGQIELQQKLIDAQDDPAKKERMTLRLAQYIQDTNDLLGDDIFQAPSGLQLAGAAGTVAANVIPALGAGSNIFKGAKIGTKLGTNILGETLETGFLRKAPSLLQRSIQAGVEGGLFLGSQEAAKTGDPLRTAESAGLGLGFGLATPPVLKGVGKVLSPVVDRFSNPLVAKTELGRKFFQVVSPVSNIIKGAGAKGQELYTKLENIRINRDLFRAKANQSLDEFQKVYKPLTQLQKDEFYNITSQNTAANPVLKKRGMYTSEELASMTTDPAIREAILKAEPITKEISEAQVGRAFKGGEIQPVSMETGKVLPSEKNISQLPKDIQQVGKDALKFNNAEQFIAHIDDIKARTSTGNLTPEEKLIAEVDATLGIQPKGITREQALTNIFEAAKRGTLDETLGGIYGKRAIKRVAETPSIFFPTTKQEKVTGIVPDIEDRVNYFLEHDPGVQAIAKTDPEYAKIVARNKAEEEVSKTGLGPGAGKAKEVFIGDAIRARENGIETDALRAYQQHIDRESEKAAQLQEFGLENITGKVDATTDEIAQAQLDRFHGEIRKELESKFGKNSLEAKQISDLIKNQTDIFLHGQDPNKFFSAMKRFQSLKLGLSFLPNLFQSLNTYLEADLPSLTAGMRAAFTSLGQNFAKEAGAKESTVLAAEAGKVGKFLNGYLKFFKFTEQNVNRTIAANTAATMAERLARVANDVTKKESVEALTRLEELVGKKFEVGKLIELTDKDLLRAANRFTKATQFGSNPLDLPFWANSPLGSVFFQFKSFAYNQLRFVADKTIGELRAGNPGRAARNFGILATLFPMSGAVLNSFRNVLTGNDTNTDLLTIDGYLNNMASVGGMGIAWDILKSTGRDPVGLLKYLGGPSATTLSETAFSGFKALEGLSEGDLDIPLEQLYKLSTKQFGGLGSTVRNITEEF